MLANQYLVTEAPRRRDDLGELERLQKPEPEPEPEMRMKQYLQGMGFSEERATRTVTMITDMTGGDDDVWALLQVVPDSLLELSRMNRLKLQDAINSLRRARDTGKTPQDVVRDSDESSRRLVEEVERLETLEDLQTKVKTLDAKNKRLRDELQKTQLQLADTVAHVLPLQNKITSLENQLSMQPHIPEQIKMRQHV